MSGRYRELPREFYLPDLSAVRTQVGKPGSYRFEPMITGDALVVIEKMCDAYDFTWDKYQELLAMGVAKELARNVLSIGIFTEFMFKCNFRSLMNFISLRADDAAMYEIRQYAQAMAKMTAKVVPAAWAKFEENGRVCP
jgi:thymidylate synthase (FAD)